MTPRSHRSIGEVLHVLEPEFPDVTISKIRFLESQGLLNPERTASGYRKFSDDDVERLRWVLVQQRDNFLPLRVIKQRLDVGDWGDDSNGHHDDDAAGDTEETSAASSATRSSVFGGSSALDRGMTDRELGISELAEASGLEIAQIRELQKVGVLEPRRIDPPVFDGDALIIAKAAAGFMRHGLEARHLKAWRIAAEREAGMLEQLAVPVSRQGGAGSKGKAIELANELVGLGADLRHAMIRRYLRASLGLD